MKNTVRAKLDELLNWYDQFADKDVTTVPVCATANTVRKFARKKKGQYVYRERIIIPIRPTRTRDQILADKMR